MKIRKTLALSLALLLSCTAFTGCTTQKKADNTQTDSTTEIQATDYSQGKNWLSVPTELDKEVDVFYLYPTSWQKTNESDSDIADIDNPMMVQNAQLAFQKQATAFETVGNIYAPYYRQEDSSSAMSLTHDEQQEVVRGIPTTDAIAAFDYYIKNYNNGRPFILASHSQGSNIMIFLLADYMKEHPDVYNRMIAAYVIGYSVTDEYLAENPHLKFAQGPDDTGVIVSYNTEAETVLPPGDPVVTPGALVINPINWTRDETLATAAESLGSIELNPDGSVVTNPDGTFKVVKNFADAQVDTSKGALICSTADVDTLAPGNAGFGKGVFHTSDYSFYYFNLRENAVQRTESYLLKHKK